MTEESKQQTETLQQVDTLSEFVSRCRIAMQSPNLKIKLVTYQQGSKFYFYVESIRSLESIHPQDRQKSKGPREDEDDDGDTNGPSKLPNQKRDYSSRRSSSITELPF